MVLNSTHYHLFALLDRHRHTDSLVLVLALLNTLFGALHLRSWLAVLFHLFDQVVDDGAGDDGKGDHGNNNGGKDQDDTFYIRS